MTDWMLNNEIDLVIIGPEGPLAKGIVNHLSESGIRCFGPTAEAALIESDKEWSKAFMDTYGIPTARWKAFVDADEAKIFIERYK